MSFCSLSQVALLQSDHVRKAWKLFPTSKEMRKTDFFSQPCKITALVQHAVNLFFPNILDVRHKHDDNIAYRKEPTFLNADSVKE